MCFDNCCSAIGYLYELASGKLQFVSTLQTVNAFALNTGVYGLSAISFNDFILHSNIDSEKEVLTLVCKFINKEPMQHTFIIT